MSRESITKRLIIKLNELSEGSGCPLLETMMFGYLNVESVEY